MSGEQPGVDFDVPDAAHATILPVESSAVTFELERVFLSGKLRPRSGDDVSNPGSSHYHPEGLRPA